MRSRTVGTVVPTVLAVAGAVAATMIGRAMALNGNTIGFVYLVVVLVASLRGELLAGSRKFPEFLRLLSLRAAPAPGRDRAIMIPGPWPETFLRAH